MLHPAFDWPLVSIDSYDSWQMLHEALFICIVHGDLKGVIRTTIPFGDSGNDVSHPRPGNHGYYKCYGGDG